MHMELGGKFVNSFIMKTQILERLQCVSVVEGATHSQKDGVEGNGGSLKDGAEYRKAPPPRKGKENQWGSRGLQAWPETGS
jgi:hypothetical protein